MSERKNLFTIYGPDNMPRGHSKIWAKKNIDNSEHKKFDSLKDHLRA